MLPTRTSRPAAKLPKPVRYNGITKFQAGQFIKEAMSREGVTGEQLADALGVYPSYISQLVTGAYDIRSNHYRLALIIDHLGISTENVSRYLGVDTILTPKNAGMDVGKLAKITLQGDFPHIKYLGSVQAMRMIDALHATPTRQKSIACPLEVAKKYPKEELFVLQVLGESMADKDIRRRIPEGAYVLFSAHLHPKHRDIVVAWIPSLGQNGLGVLKEYREQGGQPQALWSYAEDGMRLPAQDYPDIVIQGVYLGFWLHDEGRRG